MSKIILEAPIARLYSSTESNFDSNRSTNSSKIRIDKYEYIPAMSDNILQVKFKFSSPTSSYTAIMSFDEVQYVNEASNSTVTLKGVDGSEFHIEPISYNNTNAQVRCECLDFYYRFATWNARDNSLYGDSPKPYIQKTNRPPVNPTKTSGLCKHLMQGVDFLKKQNVLK